MRDILRVLRDAVDDAGRWWPADSRFEIFVGAILTQNTSWTSVEKALVNLEAMNLIDPDALLSAEEAVIGDTIRPSGYWRTKTTYLKAIARWFQDNDEAASAMNDTDLRASLLSTRGVGEETADDILLYAYRRGLFIYDAYGRRLLEAAGWGAYRTYSQARRACDSLIRSEGFTVAEYAELHGLIVQAGKDARVAGGWEAYWPAVAGP